MFDKRILQLVPQARRMVIGAVALKWIALLGKAAIFVLLGSLLGSMLDGSAAFLPMTPCLIVCLCLALAAYGASAGAGYLSAKAAAEAKRTVRKKVFHQLLELGPAYRQQVSASGATQIMGEGIEQLEAYFSRYLPQLFYAVLAPLTLFVLVLPLSWPTALTLLICVPLIPISIVVIMKTAKKVMGSYWNSYIDLGSEFLDAVQGLITLKSYRADARAHKRLNARAEEFRSTTMKLLRVQLNSITVMDLFTYGGTAVGSIMALVQCANGGLSAGGLIAILLLAVEFFRPMRTLGSYFHTGMGAAVIIDKIFALLDASVSQSGQSATDAQEVSIVCEDVGFSYGNREGETALSGLTFSVPAGSYIGITGESGSGKSTLAALLAGLHEDYTGSVKIGGIELREWDKDALRRTVTCISAHSHVFKGSIRTNLLLGKADATESELWEALHRCRLHEDVLAMGGLDAEVGEGGCLLSGGQRQRLSMARALLHDTPIYLFDEATSNIDVESETAILSFIQELALFKTVVVVSHRLAVLRWTDAVYVLDHGRLVEGGDHYELIRQGGIYAQLWAKQEELERYAADISHRSQTGEVKPVTTVFTQGQKDAMAAMPANLANIMEMAVKNQPVREAITGHKASGHPSWIPRGPGAEKPADVDAVVGWSAEEGQEPSASADAEASGAAVVDENATEEATESATEDERTRSAWNIIRGLADITRDQRPQLIRAVFLGVLAALSVCGIALFAGYGALGIFGAPGAWPLTTACVGMAICGVVRGFLRYGERLGTHDQTFRTLALIRNKVFGAMRKLAPAKLEVRDKGDLVSLLTTDVELLEVFYSKALAPVLVACVLAVVVVVYLAVVSPVLAIIAAAAYVVIDVVVPIVSNRLLEAQGRYVRERAVFMSSFLLDSLHGLAEVLQFGWADGRSSEMDERMDELVSDENHFGRTSALAGAAGFLFALISIVGFAVAACSVGVAGQALPALLVFTASLDPVIEVAQLGVSLHQTLAAGERILDLLDEEPATPDVTDGEDVDRFTGATLKDVGFSYETGKKALYQANLDIAAGQVVAITGPSGSGKSTILKLLMHYWNADTGTVSVSGEDIRAINSESLRRLEGSMAQETYLFQGTLKENILVVKPDASDHDLDRAIHQASLDDFVARLPQGLDTPVVGEEADVSDGERQRIGLARLFLYDAPFNLLDEPTSNLDTVNEAAVLRALQQWTEDRTLLVVSHRPSVCAIADTRYAIG